MDKIKGNPRLNFVRKFVLFIIGVLGLFGLNWFFNPSIDDTEEYWERQEELNKAENKTINIVESIESKKNSVKRGKSFLDKVKEELDKE